MFCGFFLGFSIFAPGISGSVIAIAMGIYHELLAAVANPLKNIKKNLAFLLPLALGILVSAAVFVIGFKYLFETYEKALYFLFVGLIAGNLPVAVKEIRKTDFRRRYLVCCFLAFAAALAFIALTSDIRTAVKEESAAPLYTVALGGLLAGVTFMVPGMSASVMLIATGVYDDVISAGYSLLRLETAGLLPLGVLILCTAVSVVATSKGIKALFGRYPGAANCAVLGFIAGSLAGILLQGLRMDDAGFEWFHGAAMAAAGLGLSLLFIVLGNAMGKSGREAV
ncbi:MAG: DUF368 domain-containing protein [Oscillospiraceae bacterium]|nr:DUF368 domain-containing protein [Oscillospiraceae bacterium]